MKLKNKCLVGLSLVALSSMSQAADTPRVSVGADYGSVGKFVITAKADSLLAEDNALAVELGIGDKEFRGNLTYGIEMTDNQSIKFTEEYLYQNKKFDFDYGDSQSGVWQIATGIGYKYDIKNDFLKSFDADAYYVYSPGKDEKSGYIRLDEKKGIEYHNRVVGADIVHFKTGVTVSPWQSADLHVGGDYEFARRDFHYSDVKTYNQVGFNSRIDQVFVSWAKGHANASYLQQSQSYGGGLSFLLPSPKGLSLELSSDFNYEKNQMTGNDFYLVKSTLAMGFGEDKKSYKTVSHEQNFLDWVSTPVVRMTEVIASSEQKNTAYLYSYAHALSNSKVRGFEGDVSSFNMDGWKLYNADKGFDVSTASFYRSQSVSNMGENWDYAEYRDESGKLMTLTYSDRNSLTGQVRGKWNGLKDPESIPTKKILGCKASPEACQFEVRNRA